MLEMARSNGYEMKSRTFTSWVTKGLLANGEPVGRGPDAGVARFWSEHQLQLFLVLLKQWERVDNELAVLAPLPIGLWLHFGSPYVELPQVKKAMATWSGGFGKVSARRGRNAARALAEHLGGEDVDPKLRNRLADLIADYAPEPAAFDAAKLEERISDILSQTSSPKGVSARGIAHLTETRVWAVRNLDRFDDGAYLAARDALHTTLADYPKTLGADPFEVTFQERISNAAVDLLTHLGYVGMRSQ